VPPNIFDMYQILELPDVFTTDQSSTLLWFSLLKHITIADLKEKNREHPTIAIFLTASVSDQNLINKYDDFVYAVPYTNHCTASELAKFLNFLKPKTVERIVPITGAICKESVIDNYIKRTESDYCSTESDSADECERFHTPIKRDPPSQQNASIASNAVDVKNIIAKANELIQSLESDMDNQGNDVITSESFAEKLEALTRLYEPVTGVRFSENDLK
jgi:hypothetical protein